MRFRETYSEAVRDSRRIRAQRAGFWAKWASLALVITVGATLRSEPELRQALMNVGMDAVMAVSGQTPPPAPEGTDLQALLQQAQAFAPPPTDVAPRDAIRVNRPGLGVDGGSAIHRIRVTPVPDASKVPVDPSDQMAAQIGRLLQEIQKRQ